MSEVIAGRKVIQRHLPHGPGSQTPRRIIVHAMAHKIRVSEDNVAYAASFMYRKGLSAHILVAPDGTPIRCRNDDEGAWHAKGYNTDSLGIEVLVDGEHNYSTFMEAIETYWPTDRQLSTAIDVVADWCSQWDIGTEPGQLDRHCDVSPNRKRDPGRGYPWADFVTRVRARLEAL